MPALSKAFESLERPGLVVSYKLSNVQVWKGALLGVNSSGFALPMAHGTANLRFIGVANESVNNASGSAGDKSVNVTKAGSFVFTPNSGYTPAQGDLGAEVYAVNDNQVQIVTTGLTSAYKIGTVSALENTSLGSAGVRVRIDRYTL